MFNNRATCKTLRVSGFFPLSGIVLNSRRDMQHFFLYEKKKLNHIEKTPHTLIICVITHREPISRGMMPGAQPWNQALLWQAPALCRCPWSTTGGNILLKWPPSTKASTERSLCFGTVVGRSGGLGHAHYPRYDGLVTVWPSQQFPLIFLFNYLNCLQKLMKKSSVTFELNMLECSQQS